MSSGEPLCGPLSKVGLLVATAALATGCAFGSRHVPLTYAPTVVAGAAKPRIYGQVAVARFDDARSAKDGTGRLLGKVRNGYGMPTASVLAEQDPVVWVNEGVVHALSAQGLTVERVDTASAAGDIPTITGRVTRASGGMYMAMDANVAADLNIEHRGQVVQTVSCSGRATRTAWTASSNEYQAVFEAAMTDFVDSCGPQLLFLLTGERAQ
jgi:hypothetical protein